MTNTATTTKTPAAKTGTATTAPGAIDTGAGNEHRAEAKTRFNAAVQEAKAGAAALRAEAGERASAYRTQARGKGDALATDAKGYGEEAKTKGRELANDGKAKLSGGISSLSRMVADNAHVVDEKLGAQYGDYARTASRSLDDTAARLDQKSIDELTEDGREFVRKSPGLAIGMAAVAGYMLSRIFGGSRR
ncbi:hypothetical protein [Erythrobacter sp. QSSC1-22B]|uniref:hypothetical protein n=1 Tax=Erythrobacter sp. QSSC1-22B TaxID=1860125 RepID=UPI001F43FF7D|nr:hypothetical protein [Erythrobacter sp. QSSC1-22B]